MSLGITIMKRFLQMFGALGSENFDYQIEEVHHKHKKDRPSGTAKFLQKAL